MEHKICHEYNDRLKFRVKNMTQFLSFFHFSSNFPGTFRFEVILVLGKIDFLSLLFDKQLSKLEGLLETEGRTIYGMRPNRVRLPHDLSNPERAKRMSGFELCCLAQNPSQTSHC